MSGLADIYAAQLYIHGEGLPLWNPSPLHLGDIGFIRDGAFHVLFSAVSGPPERDLTGVNPALIAVASSSTPASTTRSLPSSASEGGPSSQSNSPHSSPRASSTHLPKAPATPGSSPLNTSVGAAAPLPPASPTHHATSILGIGTGSSSSNSSFLQRAISTPGSSSSPPSLGLVPPPPLNVEYETPRLFSLGSRTSTSFRFLGFSAGADASTAGVPVGAVFKFESSGGDGALLVPREPTERVVLKHVGVLKTYFKNHRRWIHRHYGLAEDLELDDYAFIYGMDRVSDWAVAVNRETRIGAHFEFQVFSNIARTGVWGDWKTACTASQRGPYRPVSQHGPRNGSSVPLPRTDGTLGRQGPQGSERSWLGIGVGVGGGDGGGGGDCFGMTGGGGGGGGGIADVGPDRMDVDCENRHGGNAQRELMLENPYPPTESIIIRRITAKERLIGHPKFEAAAGPRDPDRGPDEESQGGPKVPVNEGEGAEAHGSKPCQGSRKGLDPLDLLHEWIFESDPLVQVSIATDDDLLRLLEGIHCTVRDFDGLRELVNARADKLARVERDADGFGQVVFSKVVFPEDLSQGLVASEDAPPAQTVSSPVEASGIGSSDATAAVEKPVRRASRWIRGGRRILPSASVLSSSSSFSGRSAATSSTCTAVAASSSPEKTDESTPSTDKDKRRSSIFWGMEKWREIRPTARLVAGRTGTVLYDPVRGNSGTDDGGTPSASAGRGRLRPIKAVAVRILGGGGARRASGGLAGGVNVVGAEAVEVV